MPINSKREQGKDAAVQGTNDSSVVSKVSAAAQGYFRDDFLKHFVCKVSRRAPLINRGYYVRWKAVDYCMNQFFHATNSSSRRQILSLGAGFDSLFFRLHSEGALGGVTVFEVDFPAVARRKADLINSNACLKDKLPDWEAVSNQQTNSVFIRSGHYNLIGVDVRKEQKVEAALSEAGLQWDTPTLVLSEVVLTYMETQWSDAVIGWTAKHFPQSMFVMYEQIHPDDPFGRVMQNHFLKLNSSIHALKQYPDTVAQTQRFIQKGWEKCVCLDMNQFYFDLLPEDERHRVEGLEPFDEFEEWHQKCSHYFILSASKGSVTNQALLMLPKSPSIAHMTPQWAEHPPLVIQPVCGSPCIEAVGMASAVLAPGKILLTGGCGRSGRDTVARVLIKEQGGWKCACVEAHGDRVVSLYQTLTSIPGGGVVLFGGRTSPLNPTGSIVWVTFDLDDQQSAVQLSFKNMNCTGTGPKARWRHSSTLVCHNDKTFLFVFGGRTEKDPVLGDAHFLCLEDKHWTEIRVVGVAPEARHSHSACPYGGGLVIFGGLGKGGRPLCDAFYLRPTSSGFCWEKQNLHPPPVPRYSHSAHVINEKLVVIGGVWLQADGVPGVAVINLNTGACVEIQLDTSSVPWPLMLHSFCSELLHSEGTDVVLIGGGGNCFSFGTHLNLHPVTVNLRPILCYLNESDHK
ncbi:tRNA wybutosine-synthesizing protein 4 [Pimephales promelas]|uniref:tRNA wybutosine-synthesizing protein 4 n=1 Tax=Pimephales promelas TaxID=90988 RepID=UPI001955D07E|nr:tRNA wybutosine-synthesizing protein 4 [Pimephales promelas]KAG1946012.1 Leucine carboxyl methyltransferase [Pimephales promelas]KAG1946015.1 Leucine carboxyl methyltransferase [Pimephales promelas]